MSGWVSFDEDKGAISPSVATSSRSSELSAKNSQAWVKFEESPASSTPTATGTGSGTAVGISRGRTDTHRPVLVPQHTGGSAYSNADITSQTSDDHQSAIASSVISSRDSFSSSHDISSSREYMPLESSSPKPAPFTPGSSEGWTKLGESKKIISSTPNKVATPDRVLGQNGFSESARMSSPAPKNWVQFDQANSSSKSRLSSVSSQNNSLSLDSTLSDPPMLDKHNRVEVTQEQKKDAVHERLDITKQQETVQFEPSENTDKNKSRTTPLHMTDHAHDMEVSMYSAVGTMSESNYSSASPGNPFKEEVETLKQIKRQNIIDEQVRRTTSPYNPFINLQPSSGEIIPGKISKNDATWTAFDETDNATALQTVPSPGNPFTAMKTSPYVQSRSDGEQPYNLFPQGKLNVTGPVVTQQTVATQSSLKQVAAGKPHTQSSAVHMNEQSTAALLSPQLASPPVSPFTMKPNQWPQQQQQYIPTSPNATYPKATAITAQKGPTQPSLNKSKSQSNTRSSIKSKTPSPISEKPPDFEEQYPREHIDLSVGWSLKLRCPDKKKIAGSRYWQPVHVRLAEGNILQLFDDRTRIEPFRELNLLSNYELGLSHLQQFNTNGKIHTIKLLYLSYKEKRKMSGKSHYEKEVHRTELLKLGCLDFGVFTSFVYTINDTLMKLTLFNDRGAHYHQDMISVIVSDECRCLVNAAGDVIKQAIVVNLNILAFLSGSPDCAIGLNDVQVKGLNTVERQHIIPNKTSDWIQLHNVELHKCANKNVFADSRMIEFQPLNASQFRLMQFHVKPSAEQGLPLEIKAALSGEGTHMELRVDLLIPACTGRKNPLHHTCEDVMVCIPIPDKWVSYFRRPKRMGQSSIHAVLKKAEAIKRGCLMPKLLEISVGSAKYEHAFRGVVWRIEKLPERPTGQPSTHILTCHLNLTTTREVPRTMTRPVEVIYQTAHTTASKTTVQSLAVSSERSPEKRIRYKASYEYQVLIEENYTRLAESERDEVSCFQQ